MHPVLEAVRQGSLETLKNLINENPQLLSFIGVDNQSLIHVAAIHGQVAIVRYLVEERGQDAHVADDSGMTALHWAAEDDHAAVVKYLVEEAHVDASARDVNKGWTAFQWALYKDSSKALQFFLESRTSDNSVDGQRQQKEVAVLTHAVETSNLPLLLSAFEHGARVHDEAGRPVNTLLYVIKQGASLELIAGLLKQEHLVAHEDMLHAAVESGRSDVVTLLLRSACPDGAENQTFLLDVNRVGPDGETPLTHAVKAGNLDMVKALMSYRANPSVSNAKGESAISLVSAADMEDQPHFEQFRHCLALRQVVLGEEALPDSLVDKIYNHEPLMPPTPPPSDKSQGVATNEPIPSQKGKGACVA